MNEQRRKDAAAWLRKAVAKLEWTKSTPEGRQVWRQFFGLR
jgi:hypothetical protein